MSSFHLPTEVVTSPNLDEKLSTLRSMIQERPDRLIFIADFDHTLTTMHSNQCHDPICFNPLLPADFHTHCIKLMNTPMEDWNQWWLTCHDYVVREANLTADIFRRGMNSFDFQFRDHCHELFQTLHCSNVPSFIVSAGVQNVIEEVIRRHDLPIGGHVQFFTNRMVFDEDDRLLTFEPPFPVTSQSKHRLPLHLPDLFSQTVTLEEPNAEIVGSSDEVSKYDIALVLGDNLGDFSVLKDVPYFHTIKIGFATDAEKADVLYRKGGCDIVLIGKSHDMRPVNELLLSLLESSPK